MPSEKQPFYDPIPPTYDEALATASRYDPADWDLPRSPADEHDGETEGQSLLQRSNGAASSSRRPDGYRPPTVETDDEDSLWTSDDDSDSDAEGAAEVRREMQEMEIEEPGTSRGSLWGKRIAFALPSWKWSWRPRLPRLRIQLPSRPEAPAAETADAETSSQTQETSDQSRWRRWCKLPKINSTLAILLFARALAIFIVLGFLYLLFASDFFSGLSRRLGGGFRFNPEDLRAHIQSTVDARRMRGVVQHFSNYAHIAGTEGDYATAIDIESMFKRAELDSVVMEEYLAYINYPRRDGRAVQIMDDNDLNKAIWSAQLEEETVGGATAGRQTFAFHGHSKSGDVKGPLIYANYGSREDFQYLKDKGIATNGSIALVRYGGTQGDRALKVKAAELAGFAGCIIYSDPAEDGFLKGDVAPQGRYMPADAVQRGSVSLMSWVVGDVLTPGWESKKGQPRMKPENSPGLVGIPSLPLAWRDAQVLLQHLKGHGETVIEAWKGGVPDVEWWTGDSSSPIVRLQNEQDEETQQPIWNVYGKIIGMEQTAKSIIIGNHRDAWAFGATDPHSGTAIMVEMARIFGDLLQRGWRPLRTIEFMSWDAEEYNLIGSTEFVEKNLEDLRNNAFAYINLDTVVSGSDFRAAGSPVFRKSLMHALARVSDPTKNATLKELWERRGAPLNGLGAGSDYVAFQDISGTSSLDLSFDGPGFPYHSNYDNFALMENVIDPGFLYHSLMAQVVGLLILDLSDRAILPFDMAAYGQNLEGWVKDLETWATDKLVHHEDKSLISFQEMKDSVEMVQRHANEFEKWELDWDRVVLSSGGWEANDVGALRLDYNNKMSLFETSLLDLDIGGGIPNRTQFKHVVFGPQLWSGYDEAFFPAIRDTIESGELELAKRIIAKTAAIIRQAATILQM